MKIDIIFVIMHLGRFRMVFEKVARLRPSRKPDTSRKRKLKEFERGVDGHAMKNKGK